MIHPEPELSARINSSDYLYLRRICEPRDNQVELWIEQAATNESKRGTAFALPVLPEVQELLKGAAPIESTQKCVTFRLFWKNYAAYLVTEECVGSCGDYDDEEYEGRLFRLYSKSHFLQHLGRDTGAHKSPLLHYKICCLNHLIDPPQIEVLAR